MSQFSKKLVNCIKKMMFCLSETWYFSVPKALSYIQSVSPQFIYFISISTWGEFQICGEFQIFYSNT